MKSFKEHISEVVKAKDFISAGYIKGKENWYSHKSYKGYEFKLDDKSRIMVRNPKGGVEDTVRSIKAIENLLKNYKDK